VRFAGGKYAKTIKNHQKTIKNIKKRAKTIKNQQKPIKNTITTYGPMVFWFPGVGGLQVKRVSLISFTIFQVSNVPTSVSENGLITPMTRHNAEFTSMIFPFGGSPS
jgi:hypothetical protein